MLLEFSKPLRSGPFLRASRNHDVRFTSSLSQGTKNRAHPSRFALTNAPALSANAASSEDRELGCHDPREVDELRRLHPDYSATCFHAGQALERKAASTRRAPFTRKASRLPVEKATCTPKANCRARSICCDVRRYASPAFARVNLFPPVQRSGASEYVRAPGPQLRRLSRPRANPFRLSPRQPS